MFRALSIGALLALALGGGCAGKRTPQDDAAATADDLAVVDVALALPDSSPDQLKKSAEAGPKPDLLAPEQCDGKDNNGNGKVDEGSFLPHPWDGATFVPKGYFGTAAGYHMVIRGRYLYVVSLAPAGVVQIVEIASTDPKVNKLFKGVSPPADGYSALAAVPKGVFSAGSDALVFAHGANIYVLTMESVIGTWAKTTLAAVFKNMPYKPTSVDAADVLKGSLFGAKEDVFVIFQGTNVYSLTAKSSTVAVAATALYPPGSTGNMGKVTKVDTAFILKDKLGIGLTAGGDMQSALFNGTTGAMDWKKIVSIKGAFPCDK